jgi:hypothetical protein
MPVPMPLATILPKLKKIRVTGKPLSIPSFFSGRIHGFIVSGAPNFIVEKGKVPLNGSH